jgi:peptidoglycan hydrolase CwlO-like protein
MKPLFILIAQSATGAVITIVALLLIAAIIGYFTAWFYAKSVYTPIIKGLEEEKAGLIKEVAGLKGEMEKLGRTVKELNEKTDKLEEEITAKNLEIQNLKKPKKE